MAKSSGALLRGSCTASATEKWYWLAAVCAAVAVAARFAHADLVWVEEAYGLAAAAELLRGKTLYRDVWFDKPPLYAWFYTLCGASGGLALRALGSAWILLCGVSVYAAGRALWGLREGIVAGLSILLFLTLWIPSAVIAIAPDLLMIMPHALAVALAARGKSLAAGAMSGLALLCNSKGVFVLAAAGLWAPSVWRAFVGFAGVQALSLAVLPAAEYWSQVWVWGFQYSAASFVTDPVREGLRRTAGWLWFHAAAAGGALVWLQRERHRRMLVWLILAVAGVVAGARFFPRYYFILLVPVSLMAGRGFVLLGPRGRTAVAALLLIPAIRFGPRYVTTGLSGADGWADAALMEDSRAVSRMLPTDCGLLVWGYRPDVYVFSGCHAATPFLDSQPLTGVIADRHLVDSTVTYPDLAALNRARLRKTRPEFVVDGLGAANPLLAIGVYADLSEWFGAYEVIGRTEMSTVYRLRSPDRAPLLQKR
jgi:hypothetical protein